MLLYLVEDPFTYFEVFEAGRCWYKMGPSARNNEPRKAEVERAQVS